MPPRLKPVAVRDVAAVILGAGAPVRPGPGEASTPRPMLRIGSITLLERQVRVLGSAGIEPAQVVLVAGSAQQGWTASHYDDARALGVRVIVSAHAADEGSAGSLQLGLRALGTACPVLVCDGDLIFELELLESLLQQPGDNVLALKRAMSVSETRGRILCCSERVVASNGSVSADNYPWYVYMGIGLLSPALQAALLALGPESARADLLGLLDHLFAAHPVNACYARDGFSKDDAPEELFGGSFANVERRTIVRKQASGEGRAKLEREFTWLEQLPPAWRAHFPQVLARGEDQDKVWYEMPFYTERPLRHLLQVGDLSAERAVECLQAILEFMARELYANDRGPGGTEWLVHRHLDRVNRRLFLLGERAPIFKKLLLAPTIELNGIEYKNLPFWLEQISRRAGLLEVLAPARLCDAHGDLHFQNILVDPADPTRRFVLADPRGELEGADLFYDLGKLWHSCNGLYDFTHMDQCTVSLELSEGRAVGSLKFANLAALATYRKVLDGLARVVAKHPLIGRDRFWRMKVEFSEAMHFAALMPFHLRLDSTETRAIALYFTAVRLVNEFGQSYEVLSRYPITQSYYNINTAEEYRALAAEAREF